MEKRREHIAAHKMNLSNPMDLRLPVTIQSTTPQLETHIYTLFGTQNMDSKLSRGCN
jgi:hypothetical protein